MSFTNCFKQPITDRRVCTRPPLVPAGTSFPRMKSQLASHRFEKQQRTGSLVIECVIASAMLASCSIALVKWTHSANQLRQQANTHTAAVLIADNASERLKHATTADTRATDTRATDTRATDTRATDTSALANSIASELSGQQDLGVTITNSEFNSTKESGAKPNGTHFTITVSKGGVPITIKHCWKLSQSDASPVGNNAPTSAITPASEKQGEKPDE
jgi:hypothetical protein